MLFAIVAAILAYRRASDNGRNGWLWGLAAAALFIGTQMVVSVAAGLSIGIAGEIFGWTLATDEENLYWGPITVVAIAASFFATWLLLRYLDKPLSDQSESDVPPPPPTFTQHQ